MLSDEQRMRRAGAGVVGGLVLALALAGCAAASSSGGGTATALNATESAAVAGLKSLAAANNEPTPKHIQVVETDEGHAMKVAFGSAADPNQAAADVIVLTATGNFVGRSAKVPPGAAYPTGNILTMVVSTATGQITDWGISSTQPELSVLGPVTAAS